MISETEAVLHAHLTAAEDERDRLRAARSEASEALALVYIMLTGAEPMWAEMPWDERCARAANEAKAAHERLEEVAPSA